MNHATTGAIDTYQQMWKLRGDDHYLPEMNIENVINSFFPNSIENLVLELSNITASFYGLLLQQALHLQGENFVETLSQATFYQLGKLKAQQALSKNQNIYKDARGIAVVILSAIFTSSPEFKIQVIRFEASEVRLYVTGVDRYHRIAKMLGIEEKISWPTVQPFILGIRDFLGIDCIINTKIIRLDSNSQCEYEISLLESNEVEKGSSHDLSNLTIKSPFISTSDEYTFHSNTMFVKSIEVPDYSLVNMLRLLQQYLRMEAINFNRQRTSTNAWYMLGKRFRIYRCGNVKKNTPYRTIIESRADNGSHCWSRLTLSDSENNPAYKGLYRYRALDSAIFEKKFSSLKISKESRNLSGDIPVMPDIINTEFRNPYNYSSFIYPFSKEHCRGHFPYYPLVPGVFIYDRMVKNQLGWLKEVKGISKSNVFLDSLQIDILLPSLPDTAHIVRTRVREISHSYYRFTHEVYGENRPEKLSFLLVTCVEVL